VTPLTPTQLRAYVAVVRLGSVKHAAAELQVSESAVSLHIAQLRKEFGDKLFSRTAGGLAFTPGGLRLASRASELLGLQDRTVREVSAATRGRRLLRVAASSLFAEFAAPGLIDLFARRAADLDVELSVCGPGSFGPLLLARTVDIAIGPQPPVVDAAITCRPVMNYRLVLVVGPLHPLAGVPASPGQLREQTWLLGPSATTELGGVPSMLRRLAVPDDRQQIFQSHAAALGEAKRGKGVAPALAFTVAPDVRQRHLVQVAGPHATLEAVWHSQVLANPDAMSAAGELSRFSSTPRAIQAMMRGAGVSVGHFRPSVHVTLWS
jgi:LysR family transcriptional regulator, low CO2-responsive transcriptional regulator